MMQTLSTVASRPRMHACVHLHTRTDAFRTVTVFPRPCSMHRAAFLREKFTHIFYSVNIYSLYSDLKNARALLRFNSFDRFDGKQNRRNKEQIRVDIFTDFYRLDSIKELKFKQSFVLPVKNYNKYSVFLHGIRILFRIFKLPIKIPTRIIPNEDHELNCDKNL